MARGTYLEIELGKISENARRVARLCAENGIEVLGVTKGFSAAPCIVRAIAEGGINKFADARLENVIRLRERGFEQNMTLLRIPMLSQAKKVVEFCDCSLNSELTVISALSDAALAAGKVHDVVLMIDVGDMREGIFPQEAARVMKKALGMQGINVLGVGTNMGCFGGILPTDKNLSLLCRVAAELEEIAGRKFDVISGGGTSSLMLVKHGKMPQGINQLRVGEGILLGTDTTHNSPIPWLEQNAFILRAEIVEIKSKPSLPYGEIGLDAFGNVPKFVDNGIRKRAIAAIGRQDVPLAGVIPADSGVKVLGASSDHMIFDIEDSEHNYSLGEHVELHLNYQGLMRACSSKYIRQEYISG